MGACGLFRKAYAKSGAARDVGSFFYSSGEKKEAQMDHFLRQDAAEAETQAADLFQAAVERERSTARELAHGRGVRKGYAEMAKDEDRARS